MPKLITSAMVSLDGFVADAAGNFHWAEPLAEFHTVVNDVLRPVGTYLFGRKLYETMAVWETPEVLPPMIPEIMAYVPIWRATEKVVYSTTLTEVRTANTRLERAFDADAVRQLKANATRDLLIGGPTLAAHAIRAGLVDEFHCHIVPVVAGGGLRYWPEGVSPKLELLHERRFANGIVHVRYGVRE